MQPTDLARAESAALSVATSLGLVADRAVVLHNSNKLALRVLPGDVMARVAPPAQQMTDFEIGLAQELVAAGCPVAALDPRVEPRVYERDGFAITWWTFYPSVSEEPLSPPAYADALHRLHAGMRAVDVRVPHFTDRVRSARALLADRERTPELAEADRRLLDETLERLASFVDTHGRQQLLHGEPHPGNLLDAPNGPVFIDLETCCRGPVEFDLAHVTDVEVAAYYPGLDQELLRACRLLVLAMIVTWRWDRDDELPDGRNRGNEWLAQLRAGLDEGPA